jgi:glycosyltransferase involved in cell wall biosynthesis
VDGHRAAAERAVRSAGLSDVFEFIGPVGDAAKRSLLAKSDLFVLPTASENFGLVIGEALAAGIPVITTKGAPWSGLEQRQCGWWIDRGVEPLVNALKQAIALTPDERRAMGRRGRAWIDERFSWNRVGAEMVAVYDWILSGGTRPAWVHCA